VEKIVAALPKDVGQVCVETFETLLHVLAVFTVNKVKDNVACAVCIGPFLHFEREFELSLAHFEKFGGAIIILKCYRVGNVVVLD
jgi:hypothetical protein